MKGMLIVACFMLFWYSLFAQSTLVLYRLGNKWGYSDTLGRIVIAPAYDRADLFYYGEGVFNPSTIVGTVLTGNKILAIDQKAFTDYFF